jgi:hypothetical protein
VAVEQLYRYVGASSIDGDGYLATSGGPCSHPVFFSGFLPRPRRDALALLTVAKVADKRFYTPAATIAAEIRAADPVVTSDGARLRFEAFSRCNGVYARYDLEQLDGELQGVGATNVDFNSPFQHALSGLRATDPVHLSVGADEVVLARLEGTVRERRVDLPERWIRGFGEVGVVQSKMPERFDLDTMRTRRLLSALSRTTNREQAIVSEGGIGPGAHEVHVGGLDRLRTLAASAALATGLRVFGGVDEGDPSAWEADLGGARLTIVVTGARNRGFSGEGGVLIQLVTEHQSLVAGMQGLQGFDRGLDRWFERALPFDLPPVERLHPRLRDARQLVADGAVVLEARSSSPACAAVHSGGLAYRVSATPDVWSCECDWFAKHAMSRGPCKHVLATLIVTTDD